MSHPLLPKLKPDHTIQSPPAGSWDIKRRLFLTQLGDSLAVDQIATDLSSIPDMWARPILFEMALTKPDHPLHERVRGEWRGLLALLALREVRQLEHLTAVAVTLPSPEGESDDADASPLGHERDFLSTLAKLLPQHSLASTTHWSSLHVFLYRDTPFAMTSPTTLVATAAEYINRLSRQHIPWYDGKHLLDPVAELSLGENHLLTDWLNHLKHGVSQHPDLVRRPWNAIADPLNEFIAALKKDAAVRRAKTAPHHPHDAPEAAVAFSLSETSFGIRSSSILSCLNRPAATSCSASHVEVIAGARTHPCPLLVFDRGIADQWGVRPQEVIVSGAHSLAAVRKPDVKDALVWRAEDFFLDTLVVVNQAGAFPAASLGKQSMTLKVSGSPATPVLPFKKPVLEYFTAQELASRVRWEQSPEGVTVVLSLTVRGMNPADARGASIELSRLYRREDIRDYENVPILEVWPNLRATGWNAYYTCYSTDDLSNTFEAEPWVRGDKEISTVSMPRDLERRRYWLTDQFPEAMLCRAGSLSHASALEMQEAGILPLQQPPLIHSQRRAYRVGVDFGASSTTICKQTEGSIKEVEFENRKVAVTASGGSGQAQLYDFFLPNRSSTMPVLSIFQDFATSAASELRALLDGHAYLLETAMFRQDTPGLCFDLKWSNKTAERVKAFLTQLCLQTSAELVFDGASEVQWAFSYPTAFDLNRTAGYPRMCEDVTERCAKLTGLRRPRPNIVCTESDAAALYFKEHEQAATAVGTIFIDIGGSTTDISVWQGGHALYQASILFAGRSIFSNFLWRHPAFLSTFRLKDADTLPALRSQLGTDRKPYHARTDAILRYHSDQLESQLAVNAGHPLVKELQGQLAVGISGLFYYIGMVLRHLMERGRYQKELPNIYVGGNGSRILDWLDIDKDQHINGLYKRLLSHGADWSEAQSLHIYKSKNPKTEAARGLVCATHSSDPRAKPDILAGESFYAGSPSGETLLYAWDSEITPELIASGLSVPPKLERLSDFVSLFNESAHEHGLGLSGDCTHHLEEARRRLGQSLWRWGQTSTAEVVVEPLFIVALRHFLDARISAEHPKTP